MILGLDISTSSTGWCVFKDSKFDTTLGKYSYLEDLFFSYNVFFKWQIYIIT